MQSILANSFLPISHSSATEQCPSSHFQNLFGMSQFGSGKYHKDKDIHRDNRLIGAPSPYLHVLIFLLLLGVYHPSTFTLLDIHTRASEISFLGSTFSLELLTDFEKKRLKVAQQLFWYLTSMRFSKNRPAGLIEKAQSEVELLLRNCSIFGQSIRQKTNDMSPAIYRFNNRFAYKD